MPSLLVCGLTWLGCTQDAILGQEEIWTFWNNRKTWQETVTVNLLTLPMWQRCGGQSQTHPLWSLGSRIQNNNGL